jgi:lethal(2) giant larvae protein
LIFLQVLDAHGIPIAEGGDLSSPNAADPASLPHRVLIASEEQFKLFVLPTLKPCGKYKLTAHEGSRIRKVGFTTFKSKSEPDYHENCFVCLTNMGDLAIHSLPDLRRQVLQTACMKKEDVQAISTLIWTPQGEAFFMCSSSGIAYSECLNTKSHFIASNFPVWLTMVQPFEFWFGFSNGTSNFF